MEINAIVAGAEIWGGMVARWTGGGENGRCEGGNGDRPYERKFPPCPELNASSGSKRKFIR